MNAKLETSLRMTLAEALDPVRFALRLEIEPDSWQAEVLRSQHDRIILNCCRQAGKSTIAGILALHTALYHAPSLVLLLSPSMRQSSELFRKVSGLYRRATGSPPAAESALRMELPNGSRIISLPGKETTIRGYSRVALLVIDEASRVDDALHEAVRPMLAISGGRLALLSTPFGQRGFFYETWQGAGVGWLKVKVTANGCPRIPEDFLLQERKELGEWVFDQEYMAEFRENQAAVFGHADIQKAVSGEVVEQWQI
ncbi:terminase large subunit domain-containing protein [Candidatus Bipolaricaulota bacterium]